MAGAKHIQKVLKKLLSGKPSRKRDLVEGFRDWSWKVGRPGYKTTRSVNLKSIMDTAEFKALPVQMQAKIRKQWHLRKPFSEGYRKVEGEGAGAYEVDSWTAMAGDLKLHRPTPSQATQERVRLAWDAMVQKVRMRAPSEQPQAMAEASEAIKKIATRLHNEEINKTVKGVKRMWEQVDQMPTDFLRANRSFKKLPLRVQAEMEKQFKTIVNRTKPPVTPKGKGRKDFLEKFTAGPVERLTGELKTEGYGPIGQIKKQELENPSGYPRNVHLDAAMEKKFGIRGGGMQIEKANRKARRLRGDRDQIMEVEGERADRLEGRLVKKLLKGEGPDAEYLAGRRALRRDNPDTGPQTLALKEMERLRRAYKRGNPVAQEMGTRVAPGVRVRNRALGQGKEMGRLLELLAAHRKGGSAQDLVWAKRVEEKLRGLLRS